MTIIINDDTIRVEQSQLLKQRRETKIVKNLDIRLLVSDSGLKYRDVADELNISPEWLSRLLRNDLTPENKIRIMGAIERLQRGAEQRECPE